MKSSRVVFFGASSCLGRVDPKEGGFAGRFKSWYELLNIKARVFNLAVDGNTTTVQFERFKFEVEKRNPDFIIFQFGLNDLKRGGSRDASLLVLKITCYFLLHATGSPLYFVLRQNFIHIFFCFFVQKPS